MNKKFLFLGLFFLGLVSFSSAQDCKTIVLPHVGYNEKMLDVMPVEKINWHCQFSKNSFYVTDKLPTGALVFDISELKSVRTNKNLPSNFSVDLLTLSYYEYNFFDFQATDLKATVYFRTPGSQYEYLAVRPIADAHRLADEAILNNDKN